MKNKFIALIACLGFVASAGAVDFNNGIDIKTMIDETANVEVKGAYHPNPKTHHARFSRDCHTFRFGSSGSQVTSDRVFLRSMEYVQECHYVQDPNPPVNNHHNNHHHKSLMDEVNVDIKGMQCHERPGRTIRKSVQLNMLQRELLPWETDRFEVCLNGPRLTIHPRGTAYKYDINKKNDYEDNYYYDHYYDSYQDSHFERNVEFDIKPLYKVATDPDKNGLYVANFSKKDGKFVLNVNDRWAHEYNGEQVRIKVELYKDGFLFFDSFKGKKEVTLNSASNYEIIFAENELTKNNEILAEAMKDFNPEFNKGSKKYFVKWGFQRVGLISTNDYVNKGKTDKI